MVSDIVLLSVVPSVVLIVVCLQNHNSHFEVVQEVAHSHADVLKLAVRVHHFLYCIRLGRADEELTVVSPPRDLFRH